MRSNWGSPKPARRRRVRGRGSASGASRRASELGDQRGDVRVVDRVVEDQISRGVEIRRGAVAEFDGRQADEIEAVDDAAVVEVAIAGHPRRRGGRIDLPEPTAEGGD